MKVRFLTYAQNELDDAIFWYDTQKTGLGLQFLDEFDKAIKRMLLYPESCTLLEDGLRKCLIRRFPYGIIYGVEQETIIIIAVAHLHRKPRYWHHRIIGM